MTELSTPAQERANVSPDDPGVAKSLSAEGMSIKPKSFGRQTWERFRRHRLAMIAFVILVLLIGSFWVVPIFSPFDSTTTNIADSNQGITSKHPFGTDPLGRDLLIRTMEGAQVSIRIAAIVALVSTAIGTLLGAFAGYFGKWVDATINQLINLILVVPAIIVLLVMGIKMGRISQPDRTFGGFHIVDCDRPNRARSLLSTQGDRVRSGSACCRCGVGANHLPPHSSQCDGPDTRADHLGERVGNHP